MTAEERFWAKVRKTRTCWLWLASRDGRGYGRFRFEGQLVRAHRWAYERANGPIPDGLELDHLCRNHACVRPRHLEVVTHAENIRRGDLANRRKTHCPKRHPLSGDNLYTYPNGWRQCRECVRQAGRRWRQRRKKAA